MNTEKNDENISYEKVAQVTVENSERKDEEVNIAVNNEEIKNSMCSFNWKVWTAIIITAIISLATIITLAVLFSSRKSDKKISVYEKSFDQNTYMTNTTVTAMLDNMNRNFTRLIKVSNNFGECLTAIKYKSDFKNESELEEKEYYCEGVKIDMNAIEIDEKENTTYYLDNNDFKGQFEYNDILPQINVIPDSNDNSNSLKNTSNIPSLINEDNVGKLRLLNNKVRCFFAFVFKRVCTPICKWKREKSWIGWVIQFVLKWICETFCETVIDKVLRCQ